MLIQKKSLSNHVDPKLEKGILLLAIGHPYYGRMAYNLAMSIKAIDPSTHITLCYTDSAIAHINSRNMFVFDNKFPLDNTNQPYGVKLLLNRITPYERTIYLDVDTLWINKQGPNVLMDQLKGISFTGITEGFHDYGNPEKSNPSKHYYFWADVDEIKQKFNSIDKLYQWRSEFIYFEKSEKTDSLFDLMRNIYREVNNFKSLKKFVDNIPDELAINIACAIMRVHPHIYKWKPTYWDLLHGGNVPGIDELSGNHYLISCGSNRSGGALKRLYDRITAASAYRLKLQHVFPLVSKKEMMSNRQLM